MPNILLAAAAPPFFGEVAILIVATALVAYLCHRLGVIPIVSFLVTGALIGPHALGFVEDPELIEAAAEIGVILLLFTIGIEFSLEKLGRIQRLIFLGGGLQVGIVIALTAGLLAWLADVPSTVGVFTGFLVALSSTAIVMKLLMDRGETGSPGGQAALGILIFQDLAVVAMVLLVPILGGAGGSAADLAWVLAKAIGIIGIVLLVARRVMPRVMEAVARTCSQEIFLLAVIAICFGTAWATSAAGVSLSLGAFLAGLIISESRFSQMAFGEILPLQILFSALFFVSVGLLLDVGFILRNPLLIGGVIVAVLLIKAAATGVSMKVLGYGSGAVAYTSLMLIQVGEFSFVLERAGREVGLYPAGLQEGGPEAFIAGTVLLMMATPYLATAGSRLSERDDRAQPPSAADAEGPSGGNGHGPVRSDHVIIAGYGATGRILAPRLAAEGIPYVIVTLSPDGAEEAEADGLQVMSGNYTRQHELALAGARSARLLVVADDDPETAHRVVHSAHAINPLLRSIARTTLEEEIGELVKAGATSVIADDREGAERVVTEVVDLYRNAATFRTVQLDQGQIESSNCSHVDQTRAVQVRDGGCRECLRMGDRWIHLRVCMTCGEVGCCDSSKNRHASKHHHVTGHPIIRSLEKGEDWAWCYVDETTL